MLISILSKIFIPLLSLIALTLGSSLITTLLGVRLHEQGSPAWMAGVISFAFYGGMMFSSFRMEHFISKVGYIRAYAAFASTLAVVSMLVGIWDNPWIWCVLRFIAGYSLGGLFIVIESWLLSMGSIKTRGQILAIYMIALYGANACSQFFLNIGDINSLLPFAIATIFCSLSVIPLTIVAVQTPQIEEPAVLNLITLFREAPTGMLGSIVSGLILGPIYGLLPFISRDLNFTVPEVAWVMSITIFGGMLLQYPIGRLSDYFDRRIVLIIICGLLVLTSIGLIMAGGNHKKVFIILSFFMGGFSFVIYPLAISHACDHLESNEITAATGGLVLAYGLGAMLGPLFAPLFTSWLGPEGLFAYFILLSAALAGFTYWRRYKVHHATIKNQEFVMSSTTPIANELDPRMPEEEHKDETK